MNRVEMTSASLFDEFPSRVKKNKKCSSPLQLCFCILLQTFYHFMGFVFLICRTFLRPLVTLHENMEVYCGKTRRRCAWW